MKRSFVLNYYFGRKFHPSAEPQLFMYRSLAFILPASSESDCLNKVCTYSIYIYREKNQNKSLKNHLGLNLIKFLITVTFLHNLFIPPDYLLK